MFTLGLDGVASIVCQGLSSSDRHANISLASLADSHTTISNDRIRVCVSENTSVSFSGTVRLDAYLNIGSPASMLLPGLVPPARELFAARDRDRRVEECEMVKEGKKIKHTSNRCTMRSPFV